MNIILNKVRIYAPIETVFGIVTTAKFWPKWHPSTIRVGGTTERPYQLGDQIDQVAYIAGQTRVGTWTVTEHTPLEKSKLEMGDGTLAVRYTFAILPGCTRVIRRLTYPARMANAAYDLSALEMLLHNESAQGLQQLKRLIEDMDLSNLPSEKRSLE